MYQARDHGRGLVQPLTAANSILFGALVYVFHPDAATVFNLSSDVFKDPQPPSRPCSTPRADHPTLFRGTTAVFPPAAGLVQPRTSTETGTPSP